VTRITADAVWENRFPSIRTAGAVCRLLTMAPDDAGGGMLFLGLRRRAFGPDRTCPTIREWIKVGLRSRA
jgi:hypothetical protein